MTSNEIAELLVPLSKTEREEYNDVFKRLLKNSDFKIYIRDCFGKSNPLENCMKKDHSGDDSYSSYLDGEKNHSRLLLKMILKENDLNKPKNKDQVFYETK